MSSIWGMLSLRQMKKLQMEMFCTESSVVVTAWVSVQILTSGCVNLGKWEDNHSTTLLGLL